MLDPSPSSPRSSVKGRRERRALLQGAAFGLFGWWPKDASESPALSPLRTFATRGTNPPPDRAGYLPPLP